MNTNQNLPIFAAVGPKGEIIKTSVSVFAAEAKRWASKRKGFSVQSIGAVPPTFTPKRGPGRPRSVEAAPDAAKTETVAKRGPGRPRKVDTAAAAPVAAKRGPGRPRKVDVAPVAAKAEPQMSRRELLGKKHMDYIKSRLREIEEAVAAAKKVKDSRKAAAKTQAAAPAAANQ